MTPASTADPMAAVRETLGQHPVALVLGHEGDGLSGPAVDACEFRARIPVTSSVDSLNVATAASIALYECTRDGCREGSGRE